MCLPRPEIHFVSSKVTEPKELLGCICKEMECIKSTPTFQRFSKTVDCKGKIAGSKNELQLGRP